MQERRGSDARSLARVVSPSQAIRETRLLEYMKETYKLRDKMNWEAYALIFATYRNIDIKATRDRELGIRNLRY